MKVYIYDKCSTCRDAVQFLEQRKIQFKTIPIRETPPSLAELKQMLNLYQGNIRKLFNTSGLEYKALGLKDKLPAMDEPEALKLLASNGKLVKRPFVLLDNKNGLVGFKREEWGELFPAGG
ncbi:MAG: Spx/MgsR family RNA polymerase-binding regulatory protein [Verrucomicrobiota bacterium]|nr:Spx/MgsR family RNA polymerase-binding regulatory protein [Verrucomicrobiota bacterium]